MRKELEGLFAQGVFEIIEENEIPYGAVILPSRMIYGIKNPGTLEELCKARLNAGGHRDRAKVLMIHNSGNVRHVSIRLKLSAASNEGWQVWTKDAVQAYVKTDAMTRIIVLIPAPEFGLPPNTYIRVWKYL